MRILNDTGGVQGAHLMRTGDDAALLPGGRFLHQDFRQNEDRTLKDLSLDDADRCSRRKKTA